MLPGWATHTATQGPTLKRAHATTVVKFFIIYNKSPRVFILRWALQILQLVLTGGKIGAHLVGRKGRKEGRKCSPKGFSCP